MVELAGLEAPDCATARISWRHALGAYQETKETGFALLPSLNRRAIVSRLKQRTGVEGLPGTPSAPAPPHLAALSEYIQRTSGGQHASSYHSGELPRLQKAAIARLERLIQDANMVGQQREQDNEAAAPTTVARAKPGPLEAPFSPRIISQIGLVPGSRVNEDLRRDLLSKVQTEASARSGTVSVRSTREHGRESLIPESTQVRRKQQAHDDFHLSIGRQQAGNAAAQTAQQRPDGLKSAELARNAVVTSPQSAIVNGKLLHMETEQTDELARLRVYAKQADLPGTLDLSHAKQAGPIGLAALLEFLLESQTISKLRMSHSGLTDGQLQLMLNFLCPYSWCVSDLDISHNCLTHQCCEALGVILWARKAVTQPKAHQSTTDGDLCVRVLRQPGVLTSLSLEGNSIGDRGASALCTALARPCSLTSLNLQACNLTEKSCISLCALLQGNAGIRVLQLGWNQLRAGCTDLGPGLASNGSLHQLDLQHNGIGDKAFAHVAASLHTNQTLKRLDLASNSIGRGACAVLADAIPQMALSSLNLSHNPVGSSGARKLLQIHVTGQLPALNIWNCAFYEADGHSGSSVQPANQVHRLDLADPADRQAAHELAELANTHGWECWRSATLDDKPLKLSSKDNWPSKMPPIGRVTIDFRLTKWPRREQHVTSAADFQQIWQAIAAASCPVTDQWRLSYLDVLCLDAYFTLAQALQILKTFAYPGDRVEAMVRLWPRCTDHQSMHQLQGILGEAGVKQVLSRLGPLRFFTPAVPSGSYSLALGLQAHRLVAMQLLELYVQQHEDGLSTNPLNMSWVHPQLNGTKQDIQDPHEWNLPSTGVLDLSFSDRRAVPDRATVAPLSPLRFSVLCARLANLSTADGNALLAPPSAAEVKAWFSAAGCAVVPISPNSCIDNLRVWAANHTITLQQMLYVLRMMPTLAARVHLCVIFWARLVERDRSWPKVMDKLAAAEQVAVCQQLGYSNVLDIGVLDMHYSLRMNHEDEYQVAKKLYKIATVSTSENLTNICIDGIEKKMSQGANMWAVMLGGAEENSRPSIRLDFDFKAEYTANLRQEAAINIQSVWTSYRSARPSAQHQV
ncbi:hypothetical protein WJX74_005783 [Apatococcus lobatus]|uniref:DUF4476 domain-containing protein n=1 Tax=Apatococcus lobatus TaxID=904363 RepID=A0AAW1SDZ6_9CHLO